MTVALESWFARGHGLARTAGACVKALPTAAAAMALASTNGLMADRNYFMSSRRDRRVHAMRNRLRSAPASARRICASPCPGR